MVTQDGQGLSSHPSPQLTCLHQELCHIAGRFPHAQWGPVEVREILFFDRV